MNTLGAGDGDDGPDSEWDAYSDYAQVSQRVTESISDAMDAYAALDNAVATGNKLNLRERTLLRADILAAAMRLQIELEAERDRGADYAEKMLDRWEGDEGYINRFRTSSFVDHSPEWFNDFASDIRRAGWELGYLQAGRENKIDQTPDGEDGDIRSMIDGGEI